MKRRARKSAAFFSNRVPAKVRYIQHSMFALLLLFALAFVIAVGTLFFLALYMLFRISVFLPLVACCLAVPFLPHSFWHAMPYHAVIIAILFALGASKSLCDAAPKPHRLKKPLAFLSLAAIYGLVALLWFPATTEIGLSLNFEIPLIFGVFANVVVHMMWENRAASDDASRPDA